MAHAKGLELSVGFAVDLPEETVGDVVRVRQILLNLVSNAIKFTKEGGVHIEVRPLAPSPGLRFSVIDTGPGLEPGFEPFQLFNQGAGGRTHGGTGLGLAISRRLTELMRGTIGFEQRPEGGAEFWVEIPLPTHRVRREPTQSERRAWVIDPWTQGQEGMLQLLQRCGITATKAPTDDGPPPPATDVIIVVDQVTESLKQRLMGLRGPGGRIVALTTQRHQAQVRRGLGSLVDVVAIRPLTHGLARRILGADVPPPAPVLKAPAPHTNKRILIVEDNEVNQMLAQRFLEIAGYDSEVASSGQEALEQITAAQWDAILMDCRMPRMDGWETTRAIRSLEAQTGRHVPIIAMTADAQEGSRARCIEAGMDEYLPKPVDPDLLTEILRTVTGESRSHQAGEGGGDGFAEPAPIGEARESNHERPGIRDGSDEPNPAAGETI